MKRIDLVQCVLTIDGHLGVAFNFDEKRFQQLAILRIVVRDKDTWCGHRLSSRQKLNGDSQARCRDWEILGHLFDFRKYLR